MSVWKTITDYPNYEVSDAGEVRNVVTGKMLKPGTDKGGYHKVSLCNEGMSKSHRIHRIVALHHIENPENKPCVDHVDRNRTNNTVENLRWATHSENSLNMDYIVRKSEAHHITVTRYGTFEVAIRGRTKVSKTFKTLEEAIAFRDQYMIDNPR